MSSLPPNEGTDTVVIGEERGQVILRFQKPVWYLALDPETARQVAEKIARDSYKARFGDTPTTERRSAITDQKIAVLRVRARNILKGSFAGAEETSFATAANAIVDAVLSEMA